MENFKPTPKKMLYGINMLKHVIKKGGKAGAELRTEDLDEDLLKTRLGRIEEELKEFKTKCIRYKKENEWYRQEIENCQKDTTEYLNYLELKKSELKDSIEKLYDANRKDVEYFTKKKEAKQAENDAKITELKELIASLEEKIDSKQHEIMKLSDIMGKRARHDAEIAKIRREIQNAESEHLAKVAEIEKSLIENRYKVQKEADQKILVMQSEAHARAYTYLKEHTSALDEENRKLEQELEALTLKTQEQLNRKLILENENADLEREEKLRQDLIRIRLERIQKSQITADKVQKKEKQRVLNNRKRQLEKIMKKKSSKNNDGFISDGLDPLDLQWSEDDFSDD